MGTLPTLFFRIVIFAIFIENLWILSRETPKMHSRFYFKNIDCIYFLYKFWDNEHKLSLIICFPILTHWGRVTHICVTKLTIIGSDNGLSPGRRQAIIWTNAEILLIEPPGTSFSEILIEIHTISFKKMQLKMLSAKWRPFCLGLNVLNCRGRATHMYLRNLTHGWFRQWFGACSTPSP